MFIMLRFLRYATLLTVDHVFEHLPRVNRARFVVWSLKDVDVSLMKKLIACLN